MIKKFPVTTVLALLIASTVQASENDRVAQLEREVLELKQRIAKLESQISGQTQTPTPTNTGDGWKSKANWRRLATDMSPDVVRGILGEPERISGGGVARWEYKNSGSVTFISDRVSSWSEPR